DARLVEIEMGTSDVKLTIDSKTAFVNGEKKDMDVPALIIDDIIDTAGTLVKTAEALLKEGATRVYAACTHPVLSGPAVKRISKSLIEEVVVTNSVPLSAEAKKLGKIKVVSVGELLARGVRSIHEESSISELFS
ncbi:MAG: ribose-phosphate diphosphokinase, partial [Acidobacteria bacterium]|nr:ribose-phosphate diphosphokinase [Acidobacteriota bacterium]